MHIPLRSILILVTFAGAALLSAIAAQEGRSASLSSVSATLSTPRLSTVGRLAAGNVVGSTQVTMDTAGVPSVSTAQLADGDVVTIGTGTYTVADVVSTTVFTTTTPLLTGDADTNDPVRTAIRPTVTTRFTTTNAIPNGRVRVLIPAASATANDGIADATGFDFGTSPPTVTCPNDVTGYDFVAGTATASAVVIGSQTYHAFECRYSGTGVMNTDFDGGLVAGGVNATPIIVNSVIRFC